MLIGWMIIYLIAYVYQHALSPLITHAFQQLPRVQLLPARLFLLVHGRFQLG
jgi:hypothetical protein